MGQNFLFPYILVLFLTFIFIPTNRSFAQEASMSPVHRFWSDTHQSHFFTISEEEKNQIIANYPEKIWKYEGIAYQAFLTQEEGLSPVFRFWSDTHQSHFFTISEEEKNQVIQTYPENVWRYEGIAYYASSSPVEGMASVHRFWSDKGQSHFYTATANEKNCVVNKYPESIWRYEGQAWYVPNIGIDPANDPNVCLEVGPEIKVGLWSYDRDDLRSGTGFSKITGNLDYVVKNSSGAVIAQVPANISTKVNYVSDGNLSVSGDTFVQNINVGSEVSFESANGNISEIIFETNVPKSYVKFRGKMKLRYSETTNNLNLTGDSKRIWLINTLNMEHYVWGMGEITGTGAMEYNKVMTTSFRTYGYFWLKEATKYIPEGFTVNATPGNQLYYGYDYEVKYPRIKEAAKQTRGHILTHPQSSFDTKVAITPYSSWTDGRTRSFQERWGGTSYPWCQSVSDPWGKHPTKSTSQLEAEGNHMVGLSANGALRLATDHGWTWNNIIGYYYTGVSLLNAY